MTEGAKWKCQINPHQMAPLKSSGWEGENILRIKMKFHRLFDTACTEGNLGQSDTRQSNELTLVSFMRVIFKLPKFAWR